MPSRSRSRSRARSHSCSRFSSASRPHLTSTNTTVASAVVAGDVSVAVSVSHFESKALKARNGSLRNDSISEFQIEVDSLGEEHIGGTTLLKIAYEEEEEEEEEGDKKDRNEEDKEEVEEAEAEGEEVDGDDDVGCYRNSFWKFVGLPFSRFIFVIGMVAFPLGLNACYIIYKTEFAYDTLISVQVTEFIFILPICGYCTFHFRERYSWHFSTTSGTR